MSKPFAHICAFLFAGCCALPFHAAGESASKPAPTRLPDTYTQNVSAIPKVIYGTDNRLDIYQVDDPELLALAASVCALISPGRLTQNIDTTYTISTSDYTGLDLPPCAGEPFANQPVAANCTGFMVGEDIIATAGHCFNSTDINQEYFVFGFEMLDAIDARKTVPAANVYRGVEILGSELLGDFDYAIVRVDRPITAAGAVPLPLRRDGEIAVGTHVGVIGHPAGLPLKVAFGAETVVRANASPGFFVANTDTYGGNSGSPVFNAGSNVVEGILVRGEVDYLAEGECFVSNVVAADQGSGEEISKTTSFMQYVPRLITPQGVLLLDRTAFGCDDTLTVTLQDLDLQALLSTQVTVAASSGDTEVLTLAPTTRAGEFRGPLDTRAGPVAVNDDVLEVASEDSITVTYADADDGTGAQATATADAVVDCVPPVISHLSVDYVNGSQAVVSFATDKTATGTMSYGADCSTLTLMATTVPGTAHQIVLNHLSPQTQYYFVISAEDTAHNTATDNGQGLCHAFTTTASAAYFTEAFITGNNVKNVQATFVPAASPSGYTACIVPADVFPVDPAAGTLLIMKDDDSIEIPVTGDAHVVFFGIPYSAIYAGSNGYLTFGTEDANFSGTLSNHFAVPRISMLFDDLNPAQRGDIRWQQLSDRIVVTYSDVPRYDSSGVYPATNSNNFQVELFFSGVIRATWLGISDAAGVVGLSRGFGLPADLVATNYLELPQCQAAPTAPQFHSADTDHNYRISLSEVIRLIQFHNTGGYHCQAGTEDGFAPGQGDDDCGFHNSDYAPADHEINLFELLRLVQFFNSPYYYPSPATEDGFAPGT